MRRTSLVALFVPWLLSVCPAAAAEPSPLEPFGADEHTLALYHFDENQGTVAKDASRHGCDGEVRGAAWCRGRFGGALEFDGRDDSVFRHLTPSIQDLKTITVECWFKQDNPEGRQFLLGKDATIHFDLGGGTSTSVSLYHKGAAAVNADGLRHQQVGCALGSVRAGRWHHLAATYDGRSASFFLDGVLKGRVPAPKDFLLGVPSRGLWIGSYVGSDYWFSGTIDEVRISDCVRYDPQGKLAVRGRVFEIPGRAPVAKSVRKPAKTGAAKLRLTFASAFGGEAGGWVYLKPPGRRAIIVGSFVLPGTEAGKESAAEFDVSDEFCGDGAYLVGLENTRPGYYSLTGASLVVGQQTVAQWAGQAASRRTFGPPVLVPLRVGPRPAPGAAARIVLLPPAADRTAGDLQIDNDEPLAPSVSGEGLAEHWLDIPAEQTYRVYLRYAAPGLTPCDLVIDGKDLNDYTMCALSRSETAHLRDALWEYQGTTTLAPGPHWLRVEGILPEIVALRLEPVAAAARPAVPWERHPVPEGDFVGRNGSWRAESLFGQPKDASIAAPGGGVPALRFSATFSNTDKNDLFGGDAIRLVRSGAWDLEPFGLLTFRFDGQGTGHVVSLWAVDVKGDEKLLWRQRDKKAGPQEISVPVSFEGNSVFDPGRVTSICIELDEGNAQVDRINRFAGAIVGPVFHRRDLLQPPDGYAGVLAKARQAMAASQAAPGPKPEPLRARAFRPWTRPVVPEEHPLYAGTEPKPVTRKTLGYQQHMTGARTIEPHALDQFHKHYAFGDVCWPHIGICPLKSQYPKESDYRAALAAMEKRLEDVRSRGLLLFDIWGYVPFHTSFPHTIAPEHHEILLRVFGDRFLGYDNGEQDGRYIGSYAGQGTAKDRKQGWDDFVKWDEHVCGDSMNFMNATGSLNFSHYYAERGCRTLGLETAQGLPSDTLMFAFLRGASKQYGRLTTQASSIWSRFGYNMYHARKTEGNGGYGFGPNKGCSRSLHKRLFFAGYLEGQSIFGTETSQFTADEVAPGVPELSPLGRQHLEMGAWARKYPDRGVMVTPIALMLDFYNGWNMPRHLYRGDQYKIWGKFPYEKGDYLIDGLFRTIWPGYEDASYLRNERGFVTPTPFGDLFDVITNRCHPEILKQYPAVMLLGDVELSLDVVKRLGDYVRAGGDLVTDVRGAKALAGLAGVEFGPEAKGAMSRLRSTGEVFDEQPYTYTVLTLKGAAPLLVNEHGHPLLAVNAAGQGRLIVGAVDHWMTDPLAYRDPKIVNMEPPYALLRGVRAVLAAYFDSFNPVEIAPAGLGIRTCCYDGDPKRLLVGLLNNDLFAAWRGTLRVRIGQIATVRGLWPEEKDIPAGTDISLEVPAGDVLILDVRLK
jgi:hypothetical protein